MFSAILRIIRRGFLDAGSARSCDLLEWIHSDTPEILLAEAIHVATLFTARRFPKLNQTDVAKTLLEYALNPDLKMFIACSHSASHLFLQKEATGRFDGGQASFLVPRSDLETAVFKVFWRRKKNRSFETELRVYEILGDLPCVPKVLSYGTIYYKLNEYADEWVGDYIKLGWLPGASVHELIGNLADDYPHRELLAVAVAHRAAVALESCYVAANSKGYEIIHGDITPRNMFVTDSGTFYLLDFGGSVLRKDSILVVSTIARTPGHGPPESFEDEELRTAASDVFGLASSLFELATGSKVRGDIHPYVYIHAIQYGGDANVEAIQNADLRRLLERMLAREMKSRPRIREVVIALAKIESHLSRVLRSGQEESEVTLRIMQSAVQNVSSKVSTPVVDADDEDYADFLKSDSGQFIPLDQELLERIMIVRRSETARSKLASRKELRQWCAKWKERCFGFGMLMGFLSVLVCVLILVPWIGLSMLGIVNAPTVRVAWLTWILSVPALIALAVSWCCAWLHRRAAYNPHESLDSFREIRLTC